MRQKDILRQYDPGRGVSISTLAWEYEANSHVPDHVHGSGQLIFAVRGMMEVASAQSVWLIPPQFALWIPACTSHSIRMPGPVSMRTIYIRGGLVRTFPTCAVLHVSPLLRELILELMRVGALRAKDRRERALRDVFLLQLERATPIPSFITLPNEPRARLVATAVLRAPERHMPLAELAAQAGASVRTVQRAFQREMGTDFESWRRQLRLTRSIELLARGQSVKEVAAAVGYRQPSAFVDSFRRMLGTTPKAWMRALERS